MKKLLFYAIALLSVATALSGCKKDEVVDLPTPVISVTQPDAYPSEGGTYTISCNIENALEGVVLEASSKDEWITNIVVDGANVSFNLTMNGCRRCENKGKTGIRRKELYGYRRVRHSQLLYRISFRKIYFPHGEG